MYNLNTKTIKKNDILFFTLDDNPYFFKVLKCNDVFVWVRELDTIITSGDDFEGTCIPNENKFASSKYSQVFRFRRQYDETKDEEYIRILGHVKATCWDGYEASFKYLD